MKILIVEDDRNLASFFRKKLSENSFLVDNVYSGQKGLVSALTTAYDLIVLDMGLPDIDGLEFIKTLKESDRNIPIIVMTGKTDINFKIEAFDLGVDDYVIKPVVYKELKSRIHAILRRKERQESIHKENKVVVGDVEVNLDNREITRGDKSIYLRNKEYNLFLYLIENKDKVLTRDMILKHVWENNLDVLKTTVDVHVRWIREKVDDDFDKKVIKTVHGVGYKFDYIGG